MMCVLQKNNNNLMNERIMKMMRKSIIITKIREIDWIFDPVCLSF